MVETRSDSDKEKYLLWKGCCVYGVSRSYGFSRHDEEKKENRSMKRKVEEEEEQEKRNQKQRSEKSRKK